MIETAQPRKAKDYKSGIHPIWCPGCGHYGVLAAVTRAWTVMQLDPDQAVVVSGIGCSSRLPAYTAGYGFHGVHGRALPAATGIKLARPELTVIVVGGDGDGYSIGGNHFLHACRRNVDLTYIVMDNQVYGMTKGQPSPTSPEDWQSSLAPDGTHIPAFRPLAVALAAGANFIARGFSGDPNGLAHLVVEAMEHPGFSYVEVLSPCVTYRPETQGWKQTIHSKIETPPGDIARAAEFLNADDGLSTGIFYKGDRTPFTGPTSPARNLADIEAEFKS